MQGSLVEPYRQVQSPRIYGLAASVANAPYLLPHIRELRPTSAVDYGCGQSPLADVLRHAGVTRVARYDRDIPAFARRPQGFYDLLLSIDVLDRVAEADLDPVLTDMATLARQAIIVIDTSPAAQSTGGEPRIAQPLAWWHERLRPHFPYLEPIRVRSRARAAFKTWPTRASARPRLWLTFFSEERRYRLAKLGLGNA